MAKTRECCGALSLRRTGDLHVSLHKGFKIRLACIVPVFIEFTGYESIRHFDAGKIALTASRLFSSLFYCNITNIFYILHGSDKNIQSQNLGAIER